MDKKMSTTRYTKCSIFITTLTIELALIVGALATGFVQPVDAATAEPVFVIQPTTVAELPQSAVAAKPTFENKTPAQGATVQIDNPTVVEFWDNYVRGCGVIRADTVDKTIPPGVKFRWTKWMAHSGKAKYTLLLSETPSMGNAAKFQAGKKKCCTVYGLKQHHTYYWKVRAAYKGKTVWSKTTSFVTAEYPRILKVGKVKNIRDIGGYCTADGKRVKQGLLYRSGHLRKITKAGKRYMKETLKIKTELDLRNANEVKADKNINPLKVNYVNIQLKGYERIYADEAYTKDFVEVMKLFADRGNYPIVMHCVAGKDRTGTVAFMLGGLLGVSEEDLCKDWELTFLSSASGSPEKPIPPAEYERRFSMLYEHFIGDGNGTLQENIEAFLLGNGMTPEEIERIRGNLLE